MERFVEFNAEKFLKESRHWKKEKERLEKELESISELRGIDNNTGGGGKVGDPTYITASLRNEITSRINEIIKYESALNFARKCMTSSQNEVLDLFFFTRGYIPPLIDEYGRKYALCRTDVYKARREALETLSCIISQTYL